MEKWKITVFDGFAVFEHEMESKSGYFSIADIFAIIEANTDLKRLPPKFLSKESAKLGASMEEKARPTKQSTPIFCPNCKSDWVNYKCGYCDYTFTKW